MMAYEHKTQYYETDQMGIIHHSNYIRWFEEARVDFMDRCGFSYAQMEKDGLISPVLSVSCEY
ncbi:MAG TPA: acyl-CoA thioesterase, partial [Candidatus Blautia merdipullorum]|nr:acyl-CoA thioesterase [Candidatus Blautia merdipullorum]